jgi:hypothetical protein
MRRYFNRLQEERFSIRHPTVIPPRTLILLSSNQGTTNTISGGFWGGGDMYDVEKKKDRGILLGKLETCCW